MAATLSSSGAQLTIDQKAKVATTTLEKLKAAEDKIVILQAMGEITAKTGSAVVYTGRPLQLVNAPTTKLPAGYTMKYAVTTGNKAPTNESAYTASTPTATNAGTYYVWYKVIGNTNNTPDVLASKSVSISKASISKAAVTVAAQTYTGKALSPAPTIKLDCKKLKAARTTRWHTARTTKAKPKFKAAVTYVKATTAKAKKQSGYKALSEEKKTGKVTVKTGAKAGTYKLMVKVTAAKTKNTKAATKTVTVTVKVTGKLARQAVEEVPVDRVHRQQSRGRIAVARPAHNQPAGQPDTSGCPLFPAGPLARQWTTQRVIRSGLNEAALPYCQM